MTDERILASCISGLFGDVARDEIQKVLSEDDFKFVYGLADACCAGDDSEEASTVDTEEDFMSIEGVSTGEQDEFFEISDDEDHEPDFSNVKIRGDGESHDGQDLARKERSYSSSDAGDRVEPSYRSPGEMVVDDPGCAVPDQGGGALCLNIVADDGVKALYKGHKQGHDGDRGLDLFIPEDVEVPAKSGGFMIDLGIKVKAVRAGSKESESWILWPHPSIAETPLRVANSLGRIDADYRGSVKVAVNNRSSNVHVLKKGDTIVQAVALHPASVVAFCLFAVVMAGLPGHCARQRNCKAARRPVLHTSHRRSSRPGRKHMQASGR